ncbi:MAG: hypothetical protein HY815_32420 [Candidatus Riflebacteria bacterium]|nr:hypothetical protein [Candidatus Riflebacteria bacterium]
MTTDAGAQGPTQDHAPSTPGNTRCPKCGEPVDGAPFTCPGCATAYHAGCAEPGRCVVPGCGGLEGAPQPVGTGQLNPLWSTARVLWIVVLACAAAAMMRSCHTGDHVVGEGIFTILVTASSVGALAVTLLACGRDLRQPGPLPDPHGTRAIYVPIAVFVLTNLFMMFCPRQLLRDVEALVVLSILGSYVLGIGSALVGLFRDRPPTKARGFIAVLCGLAVLVAVPNYRAARSREVSPRRTCYWNQKTIAGAIEMYNLDKNTRRTFLDANLWRALQSGGYMQSLPQHPGDGPDSHGNYSWTGEGNGITCRVHGSIAQ